MNIYRTGDRDSSLNGISANHTSVIVDNADEGRILTGGHYDTLPHVEIVTRHIGDRTIYHATPVGDDYRPNSEGSFMFGGAFIFTSDARFSRAVGDTYGAIALHDRFETWSNR